MNDDTPAPPQARVLWILYGALITSTGIYLLVLQLQRGSGEMPEPMPELLLALGASALLVAAMSIALPRHLHRQGIDRMEAVVDEVPDPNGSVMFRDKAPKIRVFADPEAVRQRARTLFFTPFILRLAMTEAVAIFGLVLGLMGHPWLTVLPFFGAAWVLYAFAAPVDKAIYGPVAEAFEARFE